MIGAVREGNVAKAREALRFGGDIEKRDINGNTPLLIATEAGNLEMVNTLIKYHANVKAKDSEVGTCYTQADTCMCMCPTAENLIFTQFFCILALRHTSAPSGLWVLCENNGNFTEQWSQSKRCQSL